MATEKTPGADASGDENALLETEAKAEETEETETEESEDEGEESAEEDTGDEKADGEDGDKPSKSKIRRERRQERLRNLEEIARRESERADAYAAQLKALSGDLGPEPKRSDYDNEQDYIAEKAAWRAEQRAVARQQKATEAAATNARASAGNSKQQLFHERAMSLVERYPDIEAKVFQDASLPISPEMATVLMDTDRGPEVAYYLATHREEARRIVEMQPLAAARELGRIEAKLDAAAIKPRTETKVPKPVTVLGGNAGRVQKDPDKMNGDEWLRWRNAQLKKKRA